MKTFFLFFLATSFALHVGAQDLPTSNKIDSLKKALFLTNADTNTVKILLDLSLSYQWTSPDSAISYCLRGISLARKLKTIKEEIALLQTMGRALAVKGNYSSALQINLKALQLAEDLHYDELINWSNAGLGDVYFFSNDYAKALPYYYKLMSKKEFFIGREEMVFAFIGRTYFHLNKLDSALFYIQKAYYLDSIRTSPPHWPVPYYYLAQIYTRKEKYEAAIEYYRTGIFNAKVTLDTINGYNGMAAVFKKSGEIDSAIYYSKKAISLAQNKSFSAEVILASSLLTDIYRSWNKTDSAFKYQEILLKAKETLFSQEKVKQIENLSINEKLRQLEIEKVKIKAVEERKTNLQLIGIAVFIINFFLLVLILSRRKVKAKTVEIMGLLALLLLFEFIFLFIHPYIEEWTNHTPIYMLLILVGIASVLVPMHHKLIDWVRTKLVQYNKLQLAENKPIQPNEKDEDQPIDY